MNFYLLKKKKTKGRETEGKKLNMAWEPTLRLYGMWSCWFNFYYFSTSLTWPYDLKNIYIQTHTNLSKHVAIEDFENLIKAKLSHSLHGVAKKRWCPSFPKSSHTFFGKGDLESFNNVSILARVNLSHKNAAYLNLYILYIS